jgi:hypothetical protein
VLLTRSFGQRAMKGCDTFTVPRRAQAAGRIYPREMWPTAGAVSITLSRGHRRTAMSARGPGRVKTPACLERVENLKAIAPRQS